MWVDDNPENNNSEVESAKSYGITVIQKTSTSEAEKYLKSNPHLKDCAPSHFRIITDCYREGEGEDAGFNLIKKLRKGDFPNVKKKKKKNG